MTRDWVGRVLKVLRSGLLLSGPLLCGLTYGAASARDASSQEALSSEAATPASAAPLTTATAARALEPPVIDGLDTDAIWRTAPAFSDFRQFAPRVRRGAVVPHRVSGGLRRGSALRLCKSEGSPSRQHHARAHTQRRARALRPDHGHRRLLQRPPDRLRIPCESGRGEAGPRHLRRYSGGQFLGRRMGCADRGRLAGVGGRVQHPTVPTAVRGRAPPHVRPRHSTRHRAPRGARGVAGIFAHATWTSVTTRTTRGPHRDQFGSVGRTDPLSPHP